MFQPRFQITGIPNTEEAAVAFVHAMDVQIDELTSNLELIQAVRRAAASAFGIDRREDAGAFGTMADAAKRSIYEGEGDQPDKVGRLIPRQAKDAVAS